MAAVVYQQAPVRHLDPSRVVQVSGASAVVRRTPPAQVVQAAAVVNDGSGYRRVVQQGSGGRQYVAAAPAPAAQLAAPATEAQFKQNLMQLFQRPADLEQRIRQHFRTQAKPRRQGERLLILDEMDALSQYLAQQLQVDPSIFGEVGQMFWRFDFTGDGMLNEDEATRLAMCMLRKYRDATQPPPPGVVRLGGSIAYRKVDDKYNISRKLGEGGQGAVYLAKDKTTNQEVVVKYYDKSNPNSPIEDITQEFELMMRLKHPRIAHYFDIFQDWSNIYVVQEPYFGGDLTTCIAKAQENHVRVNEPWLARIMSQVLAGVAFLHSNDIMHCDIKEPNVMITGRDWANPQVVVIDFGLANAFSARSGPGGTPGYMPPEVWTYGLWLPRGDVFSLGVMLFSLRTGRNPFQEGCRTLEEIQAKTMQEQADMGGKGTPPMQALITSMIQKDFRSRPTVAEVLESSWFSHDAHDSTIDDSVLQSIARRKHTTGVRNAILADLAAHTNLAESRELNDLFVQLDMDNDGVVTAEEMRTALHGRWSPDRIDALLGALVSDESQTVSYEEFMGQLLAIKAPEENELLWRVFQDVGGGQKRYLDLNDLAELLKRPAVAKVLGNRDPAAVMREMDKDRNGRVEFLEFKAAMQGTSPEPNARFRRGDQIQYYSATYMSWIACTVEAVDSKSGAVQVDCKPGYWFHGAELNNKLRPANKGPANTKAGALGRQIIDGVMHMFEKK